MSTTCTRCGSGCSALERTRRCRARCTSTHELLDAIVRGNGERAAELMRAPRRALRGTRCVTSSSRRDISVGHD